MPQNKASDITDKLLGGKAGSKKPFRMAAKDGVGEIFIYAEIGGGFFDDGVTAKSFADDLKALGKVRTLNIFINSPGGSVFEGVAIFNQLKRHSARKNVFIDGIAASVASVIAMAGDEINIAANGFVMIHEAFAFVVGNAADLRKRASQLEKISDSILNTYAERTGTPGNVIADMMAAETWMNAEEAVDLGFADKITEEVAIAAKFDLGQFQNVPEDVTAKLDLAKNPPKVELGSMSAAAAASWVASLERFQGSGGPEIFVPELQSISFGKDYDTGKIYVLGEWPEQIVVSPELLAGQLPSLAVCGDRLTFTCENGTAEYVIDGEISSADRTCRLIESTYEHQLWPLEQAGNPDEQPRTPHLAITKIRQRIQRRKFARKGDDEAAA